MKAHEYFTQVDGKDMVLTAGQAKKIAAERGLKISHDSMRRRLENGDKNEFLFRPRKEGKQGGSLPEKFWIEVEGVMMQLSYPEIAKLTGRKESTIYSRMHKGERSFKYLKRKPGEDLPLSRMNQGLVCSKGWRLFTLTPIQG